MRFEWEPAKNAANQKKHGVAFEDAALVWRDKNYILRKDRMDDNGELRWHAIGLVEGVLLLVVHVYRSNDDDGEEIIRIISARKAGKREGRGYFQ